VIAVALQPGQTNAIKISRLTRIWVDGGNFGEAHWVVDIFDDFRGRFTTEGVPRVCAVSNALQWSAPTVGCIGVVVSMCGL